MQHRRNHILQQLLGLFFKLNRDECAHSKKEVLRKDVLYCIMGLKFSFMPTTRLWQKSLENVGKERKWQK